MSAAPEGAIEAAARARALGAALAAAGLHVDAEPRDRLVVLRAVPAQLASLVESARRREVAALAARYGFSHVAAELAEDAS